jgi:hypothetical protein
VHSPISTAPRREAPSITARFLMLGCTAVRLAFGTGYLLAPSRMASAGLAPDTGGRADARLLVRGFGGHQLVTGAMTLSATYARRLTGPAVMLNLLIDTLDVASAALELRARGGADRTLVGGIALSGTGVVTSALALRALER